MLYLAVGQNRYPKWNPGKWKHGPKPAVGRRFISVFHTVDGRNPLRTTLKPWETIVCWYLQGDSRVSWVVQDFVHPQYVIGLHPSQLMQEFVHAQWLPMCGRLRRVSNMFAGPFVLICLAGAGNDPIPSRLPSGLRRIPASQSQLRIDQYSP